VNFNCRTLALALFAAVVICVPALGQTDLLKGQDERIEIGFGLYSRNQSGNQDTVREYDGRKFDLWGIESLNSYGYDGDSQYWLDARNLIGGDEDISFDLGVRNELSLSVKTSSMLHRLVRIPGDDPYLSPLGLTGGAVLDFTPGNSLEINRRVNDFGVRLTPNAGKTVYRANWWQESEAGLMQFNYRGSSPSRLESVDFGIDRNSDQGTLGVDLRLGDNTAVNYSIESHRHSDAGLPVIPGERPGEVVIPSIKTTSNLIKARSRLSDQLYFTGVHIDRNRTNQTASIVDDRKVELKSTNASLTFLASPALTLFGRYKDYKLENRMGPVLGDPGDPADNVALDRRERSIELESDYTGIRKALIRVGYEHRKTERELAGGFPADPDLDEMMSSPTTADIWRTSFRYHPTWKLNLSGKLEDWNISDPAFKSSPGDRKKTNLNATYTASDRLVVYADYNRLHDGRRDPAGLDNLSTDTMVGAWYSISGKLTLDVLSSSGRIDATTFWEQSPHALDPISSEDVPYKARNKQFSVGLNYAMAPKTSAYWRFLNSDSNGSTDVTGLVPGSPSLPDGWTPIEVEETRWTIGFTRDLTAKDRLLVEYSLADWRDRIDSANDGKFNLWRLAWSTDF